MPSYTVKASAPFEQDLDAAVVWRLQEVGPKSAGGLLNSYDELVQHISAFPYLSGTVEQTSYRWRALERFVVVYKTEDDTHVVTLVRLFRMSQDWRSQLLRDSAEG